VRLETDLVLVWEGALGRVSVQQLTSTHSLKVMKYILVVIIIIAVWAIAKHFLNRGSAEENIKLGQDFLTKNRADEAVQITDSGLQYKVLEPGSGNVHPSATDQVKVHYHGTLIDGTVFDSSVERGTEGLQLMVEGEKTRLFIPSSLGYGNRGAGKIQPGSTLIFDVELIGINPE